MKLQLGQLIKPRTNDPKTDDVMIIPKRDIGVPFSPDIIDIIRKREQERKRRDDRPQPVIEDILPIPTPSQIPPSQRPPAPDADRGVAIITLMRPRA